MLTSDESTAEGEWGFRKSYSVLILNCTITISLAQNGFFHCSQPKFFPCCRVNEGGLELGEFLDRPGFADVMPAYIRSNKDRNGMKEFKGKVPQEFQEFRFPNTAPGRGVA
jgi:hypothetical protein